MKMQETFDTVAKHLLKQGKQSRQPNRCCRYRLVCDGQVLKCAIGCLIPDESYREEFEEHALMREGATSEKLRALVCDVLGHNLDLCVDLQRVHDTWPALHWPTELTAVARRFGLDDKVVANVA